MKREIFSPPFRDWNHCPLEQKASVLPMSYADPPIDPPIRYVTSVITPKSLVLNTPVNPEPCY